MSDAMTRAEREDLQRLIRQREKVLKSAAKDRSKQLLADFENQMGADYRFDQDEVWKEAAERAQKEVKKAQEAIARRCAELGIPKEFAPTLAVGWFGRGKNALAERRTELRKMAQSRIAALEAEAILEIERQSLEAQTELAVSGLASTAARGFLERLPPVDVLMPLLSFREFSGSAEPPIAEQLVSPNALRQRRFRERQALRNAASNAPEQPHNGAPVLPTLPNGAAHG